ncbi:radical SAM/SPASM domain-containing protein [Flexibacterium corallicola]|uniref:radical SAM/SPASM domain-containing protein n=1 Tax=Flexibacterium corallicola TaxID=3037259 RepID=UPI00286F8D06|nr:radical SAM protein [Pseudovibrio sp. M1P-2-3]
MLTIYLKPTNRCTVGCSHCYLPESIRQSKHVMTERKLHEVGKFLAQMHEKMNSRPIHILWHGGEPLTLRPDYFLKATRILGEYIPKFTQSIQTSLIPLRSDHLPVIKELFDNQIGTSVDFGSRKLKGSVNTYIELWLKKVQLARSSGIGITPIMVPTCSDINRTHQIVDFMEENNFSRFSIERYNDYGQHIGSCDRPNNRQHAEFLNDLFDSVMVKMRKAGKAPAVNVTRAALAGMLHGVNGDRWGGDCQTSFVVIEPDGGLNSCPDRSSFEPPFSNVSDGYMTFVGSSLRRKWIRYHNVGHNNAHCSQCSYSEFCKSGCPITPNVPENDGYECSGYHSHLRHVSSWLLESADNKKLAIQYLTQIREGIDA